MHRGTVDAGNGAAGVRRGKKTIATVSNPKAFCPLDKVNSEFNAVRPNALWVVDFTYVHTWAGFAYVAVRRENSPLDCFLNLLTGRCLCPPHRRLEGQRLGHL